MSDLAVARDYLESCQAWQEVISSESTRQGKIAASREAFRGLTGQGFHGTRKLIVGGETALFVRDGVAKMEEEFYPVMQFGQVTTQGWLGRLFSVEVNRQLLLTWPIYNPRVLGPTQEEYISPENLGENADQHFLHIDQPLARPLHFPVGLINFALCYDR